LGGKPGNCRFIVQGVELSDGLLITLRWHETKTFFVLGIRSDSWFFSDLAQRQHAQLSFVHDPKQLISA
jgi:hypothetical protein